MNVEEARDALRNLIHGDGVKRASHELIMEGADATDVFLGLLSEAGFLEMSVEDVGIQPGERVPAFYIEKGTVHFGWIFWEIFSPGRMRKIYGSVHRNEKGDWAIILGRGRKERVFANLSRKENMDTERPSGF